MKVWLGVSLLLLGMSVSVQASSLREQYRQAEQALNKNDVASFKQLRQGLDGYPLTPYLDFQLLADRITNLSTTQVVEFMHRYPDSLVADRLEGRFLHRLANEQRWSEFLTLYPQLPSSEVLQCAHYRAKWATGDRNTALAGAKLMWLHGGSRATACDPLFDAWHTAGGRNDDDIWQRMLLAYEKEDHGLVTYLGRQLSPAAQPASELLQSLDKNPNQLLKGDLVRVSGEAQKTALSLALAKLADTEYTQVMSLYPKYQRQAGLTNAQVARIEQKLAQRLMFNRTHDYRSWLDSRLPVVGNEDLFELRARLAIWEQDWQHLPGWIDRLSAETQQDSRWQYWRGRALKAQNRHGDGDKAWKLAANNRDYYGFLAAQQSKVPYALLKKPLPSAPTLSQARARWPAFSRTEEWLALGNKTAARSEWYHMLGKVSEADGLALGSLALQLGWFDKSIQASIQLQAWDHLDLRFPVVYRPDFQRQAQLLGVNEATLFAITRQESAFYEQARSPVGAGGLMQLMPGTAKETAKKFNITGFRQASDVYRADVNIELGSSYFKQMLDRYSNNRVAAIAAYNAGPGRIDSWLRNSGSRPLDVWVENIPYRETRGYVQSVLYYSVIYQDMLGQPKTFITPNELNYVY
ncbi:transglycosylase SLT domain-containing protein [Oceanisphaera sp. IT1-181]|uniref:transglycosylase SLT domain-containing protein n=1 Tax=Oceanisphaera sp. IT1-181 TaxID=3081199 RepID=UPI0029C9E6E0|nr:transglycosylase SLT domain-containing protein [Oceanisphaera sp. IT1-181]